MKAFYYQIGTENKRLEEIAQVLKNLLPSFTIVEGIGCWQGTLEKAISINFALTGNEFDCDAQANLIASKVRANNSQEAVILIKTEADVQYIYT